MAVNKQTRRAADKGILCWIALRASEAWDFVDNRQVIRRAAFVWVLWLTGKTMAWTWDYGWHSNQTGAEIAMVIAAVWTPLAALQGAVFKFYDQAQEVRNQFNKDMAAK
jgi:hypothetical protein